jgi:hypothetical protein
VISAAIAALARYQKMKQILLDEDLREALDLIRVFHKRLTEQMNKGMKPHLDN